MTRSRLHGRCVRAWLPPALAVAMAGIVAVPAASRPAEQTSDDPVVRLDVRLEAGELTVPAEGDHGYLPALLAALEIPVSSQVLAFSRTSLQTDRIGPWAPRAIYFNDDVYVGAVQGSPFLEIASIDPDEGAAFYTVTQDGGARPVFERQGTTCLMCHESPRITGGVPGVMVLSVLTDRLGYVIGPMQDGAVTDRTSYTRRFGGYYVTGTGTDATHAGNLLSPLLSHDVTGRKDDYVRTFDRDVGRVAALSDRFDASRYLAPDSDVVGLMVLAHQTHVHNLITQVHQAAVAVPAIAHRINGAVDRLLRAMLFVREASIVDAIDRPGTFAPDFVARGPRDEAGRSLRDLDLDTRLFRYPLSFLIYSDAFDALPAEIKDSFYAGLDAVLDGSDDEAFAHLSGGDRRAIREILLATKPDYAWRRGKAFAGH